MQIRHKTRFIYFFLTSLLFLSLNNQQYFSPFILTPQESNPGIQTYISALANLLRSDLNYLQPKHLDYQLNFEEFPSHWTNIFFLLFTPIVKLFGLNYFMGRLFAILLNLIGMYLIINFFKNTRNISILFFPILFFTPAFKIGLSFLYVDSLFLLLIGLFLYVYKFYGWKNKITYIYILFSGITIHYSVIFFFIFILINIFFDQKKLLNEKIKNCLIFSASYFIIFFLILLIILLINPDYAYLIEKIKIRFSVPGDEIFFTFNISENTLLRRLYLFYVHVRDNFGLFAFIIMIFEFFILLKKKDFILVYFSSVILLFIVLSKYTISHNFLSLQFIFVSYLVLINFFKNIQTKKYFLACLILFLINFIFINHDKSLYLIDSKLQSGYLTYLSVKNLTSKEDELLKYNQDMYLRVYPIYYKLESKKFFYFKN